MREKIIRVNINEDKPHYGRYVCRKFLDTIFSNAANYGEQSCRNNKQYR